MISFIRRNMIKQGTRVKIINGEDAGQIGVVVAKAPGSGDAAVWNVAFPGKGQVRAVEKDLEEIT
jgi:ribosomal protein L24